MSMAASILLENYKGSSYADHRLAVGNDLVFLPDFRKVFNPLFRKKVYHQEEIDYCESFSDPLLRYASTFAAKEATYKALKQCFPEVPIYWKKLKVLRDGPAKRPLILHPHSAQEFYQSLSITHDGQYVWAVFLFMSPFGPHLPPPCSSSTADQSLLIPEVTQL